jgi:formylmethanofuran dehydrogenase subunit A
MSITRLSNAHVIDPARGVDTVTDLWWRDGRIADAPADGHADREIDGNGLVAMAGGIDMHTHIGGGKVNIARMLLPEDHSPVAIAHDDTLVLRSACGHAATPTLTAGYRYALMGYTTCFEPAMLPVNARQAHLEMGDTPIVDHGAYAMLGSDDFLLRLLARNAPQSMINDYVAWTLNASQAIGIKVVNPGGISAFKFNTRSFDLDDVHPHYGVTPRRILQVLARAVHELGVPHPLHVHASNLGAAGNLETTLKTMAAVEGLPLHLTHIQFHSYGTEGEFKFSSGATRIAETVNRSQNISVDIGQIMFGQTVTCSGDSMVQHRNAPMGQPKKWVMMDIECDAGCGVVPFRYRDQSYVNALQWAIGLELFLLVEDPWRIVLTTDHPNGAPFTSYPHLIRLLCDKSFRDEQFAKLHPAAQQMSILPQLKREYTLAEIAIITRAGPARLLGIKDLGHLGAGATADLALYREQADREAMFSAPAWVIKHGEPVVRDGRIVATPRGATHVVRPDFDSAIERELATYFDSHMTQRFDGFAIGDAELCEACNHGGALVVHTCGGQ